MLNIKKYACEFIIHKNENDYLLFNDSHYDQYSLYNPFDQSDQSNSSNSSLLKSNLINKLKENIKDGGFNLKADFINFIGFTYFNSKSLDEQEQYKNKIKFKLHDKELHVEPIKFDNFILYKINLDNKWINCINKLASDFHIFIDDIELDIDQIVTDVQLYANYMLIDLDSHLKFYFMDGLIDPVFEFSKKDKLYIGHIDKENYSENPEIPEIYSDIYWSHDYMDGFTLLCDIPGKQNVTRLNMENEDVINICNELSSTHNSYHIGPMDAKKIKLFICC
jgi:hypothetical protein